MGPIEEVIRGKLFPLLFGGEEITANFREILGHSVKHGGLVIPDPRMSEEIAYNTSKAASGELLDSLLGGCVPKASQIARRTKMSVELAGFFRQQEQAGG